MRSRHSAGSAVPFGVGGAAAAFLAVLIGQLDLTTNTQMLGLAAAAMTTPFVNTPKDKADKRLAVAPVPLFVRVQWGTGLPHDIDTWVRCASARTGDRKITALVGFKVRSSEWLNLQRDDQGGPSALNEELVLSNSDVARIPANTTCAFNVHLYSSHGGAIPVDGKMLVIQDKDSDKEVLVGDVAFTLMVPGQEITVISATWGADGSLMKEAVELYPGASTTLIATREEGSHGR